MWKITPNQKEHWNTGARACGWLDGLWLLDYGHDNESKAQWKSNLEALLLQIKDEEYFDWIFNNNLKWTYQFTLVVDFSNSHYIYNRKRAKDRMQSYLQAIEAKKTLVLTMQEQVQFLNHALGYRPRQMMRVIITLKKSWAN